MIELCQIFALTRPGASAPGLRLSFGATRAELKGMADQESPLAAGMLGAADTTRSRLAGATPPALPRPRRHIAATALTAFAAVEPVACAPVGDNIIRPNAWPPAPPPRGAVRAVEGSALHQTLVAPIGRGHNTPREHAWSRFSRFFRVFSLRVCLLLSLTSTDSYSKMLDLSRSADADAGRAWSAP